MKRPSVLARLLVLALSACGGSAATPPGTARPVDAVRSTLTATPTIAVASGSDPVTLTVTALDADGTPCPGRPAAFSVTGSGGLLSAASAITGGDGVATVTLTSTRAEEKIVTASVDGVVLAAHATVVFQPGAPSAVASTLVATPSSVPADGTPVALVATVRDQHGNLVPGANVLFSSNPAATLAQPAGPTGADGVATGSVLAMTAGARTVSASVGAVGIAVVDVSFTAPPVPPGGTVGLEPQLAADGTPGWFGLGSDKPAPAQARCRPTLKVDTTADVPGTVRLFLVAANAPCDAGLALATASAGVPAGAAVTDFTGQLGFLDGQSGRLCSDLTLGATTVAGGGRDFTCDLQVPAVAFAAPAEGQPFVAFGQTVAGAIANQVDDPLTLVADVAATVTAGAGAVVSLRADGGATAIATVTLASAASGRTVDFVAVRIPIPAGAASAAHTLSLEVVAPSGNGSAPATRGMVADVFPPAAVAPVFTVRSALAGVVAVSVASLPGDDGQLGAVPAQWEVRYSTAQPLTAANWTSAGVLLTHDLAGPLTAGPTLAPFDLLLPTDQATLSVAIRVRDRLGNLSAFTAQPISTQLWRSPGVVSPNSTSSTLESPAMRVADLDGDGYDDVVVAYPHDAGGDGRIHVWFGAPGGPAATPMSLKGALAPGSSGLLGYGTSFAVADLDGDGLADVVAAETDCVTANVLLWTGAALKASKGGTAPAPAVLRNGADLLGGALRAVGRISGQAGAGDDLLVLNTTPSCGAPPASVEAWLLPRGQPWNHGASTNTLFGTTGAVRVQLPAAAGSATASVDAAAFAYGAASGRDGLAISVVDPGVGHELRAFGGDLLLPAGTVAWTAGKVPGTPVGVGATSSFGLGIAGGRDAVGDACQDLAVADATSGQLFVYDGAQLLTPGALPSVAFAAGADGGSAGSCALLLPDLDGDGKAELTGCAAAGLSSPAYVSFGFGGTSPPWSAPFVPGWAFSPGRGQRITAATGPFAQAIGAGRVSSTNAIDLVVLSHAATGSDVIRLLH